MRWCGANAGKEVSMDAHAPHLVACDGCHLWRSAQEMTPIGSGERMTWLCRECVQAGKGHDLLAATPPARDASQPGVDIEEQRA
jgi:hypothetical protein